ncbi:MAG: hypothetical protein ACUVR2_11175, partial [Anaerolineae bacterium]
FAPGGPQSTFAPGGPQSTQYTADCGPPQAGAVADCGPPRAGVAGCGLPRALWSATSGIGAFVVKK